MSSSSPAPKIPFWAFIVTDIVLVGAAALIAARGPQPWSEIKIFAVAACVCVGALLLLVPWLVYVERERNELLDERQRALESLARTVTSSAEQISIAANGLHEIADIAQKNLKHAEVLPHKLQEKIAEFQAQLANANDTEREELEKELEELRGSESERLQTIADRITRTTAEFAKLETTTHQHLIAANEALTKLSMGTASAIGKAQAAAEQALAQARQEAARHVGDAAGHAVKSIEAAKAAATSEVHALFEKNLAQMKAAGTEVAALIDKLQAVAANAASHAPAASSTATLPENASHAPATTEPETAKPKDEPASPANHPDSSSPSTVPPASPPKRPRKQRREEATSTESSAAGAAAVPESPTPSATAPVAENVSSPAAAASEIAPPTAPEEPAPVLPEKITEIAPVAPHTMEPFVPREPVAPTAMPAAESSSADTETPPETAKPPRKRAAKKEDEDQPALGLDIEPIKENGETGPGVVERVLSSDGATRLIVTAYIGIGNRLFIRGSGPGLSWEKGVPLQFVSIGKWRWETNDASAPVQFKLLKNDEQESAGLGTLTIDPGHQHEVTANFS